MSIDRIGGAGPILTDNEVHEAQTQRQQESPPAQAADGVDAGGPSYMFNVDDGMETRGSAPKEGQPEPEPPPSTGKEHPGPSPILDHDPPPKPDEGKGVSPILGEDMPSDSSDKDKPSHPGSSPILY